ncbi:uncharacterized protein CC84DRAFT_1257121 [Paraphaeosphaeria sporulosa]|uniref:Uncharacterized protein n=1 Tax=Paraphaeosphaeria sporulosa TaxID=1460663 RepID=A0A177CL37_9PLEO|nr:uncharacterized protein CC84DRAFT_1257121 [Paraphaeosphaeria sporulosa]OAG08223.1 hypothetical protein CC84DRAFT_1257121 [Paraphaeosphaeria sporulosa]
MGHHHSKPDDPPPPPPPDWLPGNCPTLFECNPNGKLAKRAGVIKHVFARAYEKNPATVRCLVCLLVFLVVVGMCITTWCAVAKRQARRKRVQAARVEAEKGGFSSDF